MGTWDVRKWGYLNNPRWRSIARKFVQGGSDDYTGRESEEPQIWTPPGPGLYSKGNEETHHQCGHWHKKVITPTTAPFEGFSYEDWYSCPQFILPSPTVSDQVWYITTLDKVGIDYFRIIEYEGVNYYWVEVYNYEHTNVENWEQWQEPDGAVYQRGDITAIALIGNDDDINASAYYLETWVFDGNTLLNHTITEAGSSFAHGQIIISNMDAKFCVIDNLGYIHVVLKTYKSGVYKIYDFISTDNGASFSPVLIASGLPASYGNFRDLGVFSSGTLYLRNGYVMYSSADNGATWPVMGSIAAYLSSDTCYVNDTFFGIGCNTSAPYDDVLIMRSTDGLTYATVLTVLNLWDYLAGCNMFYDGTYYYLALMYRNTTWIAGTKSDGYTQIYRSSDGITWSLISTINDEAEIAVSHRFTPYDALLWPVGIVKSGSTLFYSFYYGSMSAPTHGGSGVYLMAIWKSEDDGVTWETVYTPYYDLTRTIPSDIPSGPWE